VGQIRHIALIGHNHCGMAGLVSRRDEFISGLVTNAGWDQRRAEDHFLHFAPMFEIGDEIEFILNEAKRLRMVYPKICIAPMFYLVRIINSTLLTKQKNCIFGFKPIHIEINPNTS
jgi:carbonic anhydrase